MKDKERIKFERRIDVLERMATHKQRLHDLEKEYREKRCELEKDKVRTEMKKEWLGQEKELAKAQAKAIELENRMKESPYKQLEALLKALLVKMPTLNITELSVSAKEKK